MLRIFFVLSIFCGAHLLGLQGMISIEDLENQIKELQEKVDHILAETDQNEEVVELTSTRPEVKGEKWFVTFDVLYWHAKVGGTNFAYTNAAPSVNFPLKGRTRGIDFGWDWGLRAGLGYNFPKDKWDIYLNYTLFEATDSHTTSAKPGSTRIPLKGSIVTAQDVNHAKSHFDLDLQALTLELGRQLSMTGKLAMRPFIGLKTAWIDLDQVTRYSEGEFLGVRTAHVKDSSHFWGLGPRFGLYSKWDLRDGFSLMGNLSGALLYGIFDVELHEKLTSTPDRVKLKDSQHRFSPTVDLFLGLGYGRYLFDERKHFSIALGYEIQYWWRQNQMLRVYEYNAFRYENISEDVSFHGVTLQLRLDF